MNEQQIANTMVMLGMMKKINAFECKYEYLERYGERIDHHEFVYLLDELRTREVLVFLRNGLDCTEYAMKEVK